MRSVSMFSAVGTRTIVGLIVSTHLIGKVFIQSLFCLHIKLKGCEKHEP